ncbi:MAG TPA: DUF4229 domain-containing protein [Pseudolysinimonas sp.]|nr:DUF4229 domain-containing protein [Pseudolysinimonas sp.]
MRAWILYSALRVGLFVVLFVVFYLLTANLWPLAWAIAAVVAALVAFCVSYIFFRPLRERVALELAAARTKPAGGAGADEAAEDAASEEGERGSHS